MSARFGTRAAEELERNDPLWPGQLATLAALLLYLLLPAKLTIGPNWPVPIAEALVLGALVIAARSGLEARRRRKVAIALVMVAALASLTSLGLLTHYLVIGGKATGTNLIGGGVIIWSTNLLLFAVLFWELDRGGPVRPEQPAPTPVRPDLLFTQMTAPDEYVPRPWKPNFLDYLYVSLTNQSAFSPTDTMPLTLRMKALMGIQGTAALVTVGVIVARAINILG